MLSLAISSCPNDTFVFCAMADRYRLVLDDVEELNRRAEHGEFDVTKISVAAYGRVRERYALLRAGGSAGFGVGPLLVAAAPREPGGRIATPGERTTAALLLRLLGDFEAAPMRFDRVEEAILNGRRTAASSSMKGASPTNVRGLFGSWTLASCGRSTCVARYLSARWQSGASWAPTWHSESTERSGRASVGRGPNPTSAPSSLGATRGRCRLTSSGTTSTCTSTATHSTSTKSRSSDSSRLARGVGSTRRQRGLYSRMASVLDSGQG